MKSIKALCKIIQSFFPTYGPLIDRGFRARTYNGDFILSKSYKYFKIHLHQSFEPYNIRIGHLVDFDIDQACVLIEFINENKMKDNYVDALREIFDYSYLRSSYFFGINKNMEFNTFEMNEIVEKIEKILLNE